jgi:hypothetical protein
MRRVLLVLALLAVPSVAAAQTTHYCDTNPQTSATSVAGGPWTWQVCFNNKDANGNPAVPVGWALYDNGARSTPTFAPGTVSPVSGLQLYSFATSVPTTAGAHSVQVAAITGGTGGGEGAKSAPFVLTVALPATVAAQPVKLSGQ